MGVVFEVKVKVNDTQDSWCLELKDCVDERVEICSNLEELEEQIEEFGKDYGGHVDEVRWLKDDAVPPFMMDDLRVKMAEHRAKLEEDMGTNLTPVAEKKEE